VLGELKVIDDHTMTMAVFFQSRTPFGSQVQSMQYFELSRVPAPGALGVFGVAGVMSGRRRRARSCR
jgi:hypothetical protein